MSGVNMSLDEIIAGNKVQGNRRPGKSPRGSGNGAKSIRGGRTSGGRSYKNFSFSEGVPEGKWQHDKFNESQNQPERRRGKTIVGGGNPNRNVTVNVSNLALNVVSTDLEELFDNYDLETAVVHFNEEGVSLGTGTLVLKRADAVKMLEDFKGVQLDGLPLTLTIIEDGSSNKESIKNRLQFTNPRSGRVQKTHQGSQGNTGFKKRQGSSSGPHKRFLDRIEDSDDDSKPTSSRGGRRAGRGGEKKAKTMEELDAELEAYMKKN